MFVYNIILYLILLKYPVKMKSFGLTDTKLFHFHRIFKNRGQGGVFRSGAGPSEEVNTLL